ncbi:hypothetical protein B4U80_05117 [Leptotrombidium deliense]|uniref:PRELI/MSF1 domain-containing protein n=1 Tax=Leptotrombidium deliense TaxID=299467 RepID=A0A443STC7_9ACAR|nr:hypothetical protein B4U80_05117 [Leptotrombidium deliense]
MVRYFESCHRYKYSWNEVVRAFWCRYPNPYRYVFPCKTMTIIFTLSEHVLSEDVVERFVDKKGRLFTKRFLSKTNRVPKLAGILLGNSFSKVVYIVEESIVDPVNKIFVTYTRNIGMQRILKIDEKVVYKSTDGTQWTEENRRAAISSSVFGAGQIEAFGVSRFRQNIAKTCKGFHMVLDAMYSRYSNAETNEVRRRLHPLLSKAVPLVSSAAN